MNLTCYSTSVQCNSDRLFLFALRVDLMVRELVPHLWTTIKIQLDTWRFAIQRWNTSTFLPLFIHSQEH